MQVGTRCNRGIFLPWAGCFHPTWISKLSYLPILTKMHIDIFFISVVAALVALLLAFIVAALYSYRGFNPPYMRIFLWYLFVSLLVEVLVNSYIGRLFGFQLFGSHQGYAQNAMYNFFTLFELLMFSWFLFRIIRSSLIKRILVVLVIIYSIFYIYISVWVYPGQFNSLAVVVEGIIIIIPSLTYYRELFTRDKPIDLAGEPSFWMVTGLFFYLATIIPVNFAGAYLSHRGYFQVVQNLYSINNFALVIANLLFIKGFTCRRKRS